MSTEPEQNPAATATHGAEAWARIAAVTSMDESAARRRYASHPVWVETEEAYQETLARVSHRCLQG